MLVLATQQAVDPWQVSVMISIVLVTESCNILVEVI
jgi:hypothetical protein